ncbi:response regulator receiver domain-containing protein [Krasilnikovia cinnamomea]|uniref:Response regulator receiver domain-containing protein n=1 Tax=Krasilnikovia cinnamomea TaxID=349313 RepID=A0A4Q7ZL40_9ACTN|nr:response regulator [Krasilnikovia cinnamomea]RZU51668.1 response regulator receiver domain-containing protein [Krasilnikovia cinnamomea]
MTVLLLAEDDPDLRDGLQRLMERAGYVVHAADNGGTALRLAVAEPPDVVLTDLDMPELDGLALCQAIRGRTEIGDIPVAVLSGRLRSADTDLRAAGVCAVLLKPMPNAELIEVVRALAEYGPHPHDTTPCRVLPADGAGRCAGTVSASCGGRPRRDRRTGGVVVDPLADSRNEL